MKKIIAFFAVILLSLSLVGCITSDPVEGNTTTLAQAQENVNKALDKVFFDEELLNNVTTDILLAQSNAGFKNVKFSWTSSEPDLIDPATGKVNRPRLGQDERLGENDYVVVTLTLTLTETASDGQVATANKSFEFKVMGINLDLEGTIAEIQAAAIKALVDNNVSIAVNDKANVTNCLTYARVTAILKGTTIVSDGTYSIAAYGDYKGKVGDLVKVQGGVRSYYGLIEFADDVQISTLPETDEHASITACVYEEKEISAFISMMDPAFEDNKIKDSNVAASISGDDYNFYAYVLKEDIGCGDDYALEDPLTGQRVSIYHYATDTDEASALIDQYVGKYVNIKVTTAGRYSSNGIYRVFWNGEAPVEASAPNLSDADRVELAKAGLLVEVSTTGEYTLKAEAYGATVSWELVDGGTVATLAENVLTVTQGEAAYTIKLKATIICGEVTDAKEFECLIPQAGPITIAEALALPKGTNVVIKGKVDSIDTAWSDQYNNITVTISDETGSVQLYRLATKVEVGQIIVVTGVTDEYKETKQIAAGATAEIVGGEVTIAGALALADGAEVVITGTVKSVDTPWSDQYNNISVTLEDETGTLYIYRLATKVEAGQKIKVTGVMATYKENRQIAAGATAEILPAEQPVETITVAEAKALAADSEVALKGLVQAVYARGFVLYDETGSILVYKNATVDVKVGDLVQVTGKMGAYPAGSTAYQVANPEFEVLTEATELKLPEAVNWTNVEVDAAWAEVVAGTYNFAGPLVSMSLNVTVSGNYINATVNGSETKLSVSYPTEDIKALLVNGATVNVKALPISYSNSKNVPTYFNFIIVEVEATDEQKAESILAGLEVNATATSDFELPTAEGVVWSMKEASTAATLAGNAVTVVRGEADVTVVFVATATVGEAVKTKEFTVTIAKKVEVSGEGTTVTCTFAEKGLEDATRYETVVIDENVTASFNGTPTGSYGLNTGKYYDNGTSIRIYQNESPEFTIAAKEGYVIAKVTVVYTVSKTGILTLNGENIETGVAVEVNAQSITFSVGNTGTATNGQVRVSQIIVEYAPAA